MPLTVRNDGSEPEIMVYGAIGDDWDGITAKQFAEAMSGITAKALTIRINSPGGNVDDGFAIYNRLRQCGARVTTIVDGMALSSAATIAMAGDRRIMGEAAAMMIHNAWGMAIGDAAEMRRQSEVLDMLTGQICSVYSSRSGQTMEWCAKAMNDETWMTPTEAIDRGFATEVAPSTAKMAACDLRRFRNAPQWFRDVVPQQRQPHPWKASLMLKNLELKAKGA